jgi:hypothetical protein
MSETQNLFPEEDKNSFKAAFVWWEKRRWRYNLIVGITGLLMLLGYGVEKLHIGSVISIIIVGVAANGCYCLGYLSEFFLKYYFHFPTDFSDRRSTIFWIGTILSVFVLVIFGFLTEFTK